MKIWIDLDPGSSRDNQEMPVRVSFQKNREKTLLGAGGTHLLAGIREKLRLEKRNPRAKAGIPGLMYWKVAILWKTRAPVMSLSKRAAHISILAGLPNVWSRAVAFR
jgi:hypothetical protein